MLLVLQDFERRQIVSNPNNGNTSKTIKAKNAKPNFGARGWLLIIAGMLCLFMAGTGKNDALNVIIPKFNEIFGWSVTRMSLVGTIGGYIAAVCMFFIATIIEKVGVKKIVVTCGFLMVIGICGYNFVNSFTAYVICVMLVLFGEVGLGPFGVPMLVQNWFPTKKGLAMGWVTVGNNLGSIFINWLLVGSWAAFGLKGGFFPWAAIGLVGVLLIAFFIKEYPEQHGLRPDNDTSMSREEADRLLKAGLEYAKTSPWTMKKLFKTPQTWKIAIGVGFLGMGGIGVITMMVPCFISKGFSDTTAMFMMSAAAVAAIPCSIGLGVIDSKFGTKKAALAIIVFAFCSLCFMALPVKWTVWVGAVGGAAMMGCTNNILASLTSSVFGRYDFQKAFPTLYPVFCIIQSSGLAIVGTLSDISGGFTVPYLVLAGANLVGFIIIMSLKDECIGRTDIVN